MASVLTGASDESWDGACPRFPLLKPGRGVSHTATQLATVGYRWLCLSYRVDHIRALLRWFSGTLCKVKGCAIGLFVGFFFAADRYSMDKTLKTHTFPGLAVKFKLSQFISGLPALDRRRETYSLLWVSKILPRCNWWAAKQSQKTFIMPERTWSLRRMPFL